MRASCASASAKSWRSSARSSRSIARITPDLRAAVAAQRHVLQHRHLGNHLHVLEGARDAQPRDGARALAADGLAAPVHRAARQRQHAGDQVEERGLAGAVGADQRDDVAAVQVEADVVDGHQPAELLAHRLHVQQALAARRLGAARQRRGAAPVLVPRRRRQPAADEAPQTVGRVLQHHHQHDAEDDGLEVAAGADQPAAAAPAVGLPPGAPRPSRGKRPRRCRRRRARP